MAGKTSKAGVLALFCVAALAADGATFVEENGLVSMETENYDNNTGGWEKGTDSGASGGQYMTSLYKKDQSKRIEYSVSFQKTGWFRVWVRAKCTSDADNDCYVMLDGSLGSCPFDSGWTQVSGVKTDHRSWGWQSTAKTETDVLRSVRDRGTWVNVTSAGEHTFQLGSRSENFRIDKVVLVHEDTSYTLTGSGPDETTGGAGSSNEPPVLAPIGDKSVNEGEELSFTVTATDPDDDGLTYSASGLPSGASFDAGTGAFSWTLEYAHVGSHNVSFTVSDGRGGSDSETVTITVIPLDTDDDGLPDGWEEEHFGNLDQGPSDDPDSDDLANEDECAAGTDPNDPDTDGDGLLDGEDPDPVNPPGAFHGVGGGCSQGGGLVILTLWAAYFSRRKRG